jgi:DNA-binding NarL/FixJ family response regulator
VPFQAILFERVLPPAYLRIRSEAIRLRALGLSSSAIGSELGVSEKTVAKAIAHGL